MGLWSLSAVLEQISVLIAATTHFLAEALSSYFSDHQITWITQLLHPAIPCPPGPPGFLLPNRTIQCYWGSETGRLETGMEKPSWVQILNRNRDGDDAKLLPHGKRTHLCGFVHSSERSWTLKALAVPSCMHCRVTDALICVLRAKCELHSPPT